MRIDRRGVMCACRLRHWRLLPYVHTVLRNMNKFAKLRLLVVKGVALKWGVDSGKLVQWLRKEMAKSLYESGTKHAVEISLASSDSQTWKDRYLKPHPKRRTVVVLYRLWICKRNRPCQLSQIDNPIQSQKLRFRII